jgi:hypothetical protein
MTNETNETSQTSRPRAGRSARITRFVLTVVIATLLGPLVGAVLLMLRRIALDVAHSEFDAADIRGMAILFTLSAYVVGGVIAFAAGLIVAIAGLWRQPTFPIILAAIVVANVGYYLLGQHMVSYGPAGLLQSTLVSLVAGAIIWLIFRRYLWRP